MAQNLCLYCTIQHTQTIFYNGAKFELLWYDPVYPNYSYNGPKLGFYGMMQHTKMISTNFAPLYGAKFVFFMV